MLFEKCELATRGDDALSSHAFDEELQEFVRQREYEMTPILTNDHEIDNLVRVIVSKTLITAIIQCNFI